MRKRYGGSLDVEDTVQETLVKILDSLDSFRCECRFTTWAITVATRVGINQTRLRKFRDVSIEKLADDGMVFEEVAIEDRSANNHDMALLRQRLSESIEQRLSDRQKSAVRALLEGMSIEAVAEKTGSNRNAVYKLVHDARVKLKAGLEQSGFDREEVLEILQPHP
ncbi:MAG: RNA polymerase sigma factor [Pirellulales bacterium]|nr:RNA polymerase sigma factor [Pirellulales bacterium]